jgi:hypothetical protein
MPHVVFEWILNGAINEVMSQFSHTKEKDAKPIVMTGR